MRRATVSTILVVLGQAMFIAVSLWMMLDGWHRDIRVPLGFSIDSLFALSQTKATVDHGWWWFNPSIGAPLGFDARAFPANNNVDQAIVWIISRWLPPNALAIMNLAWIAMVVLSGLAATWCLRTLGATRASALVAGTLFALSPYAVYRNIGHIWMAMYLVPFPATLALLLASGRLPDRGDGKGLAGLLAGCVVLGFNYVYYPFFGCFLLGVGSIVGFLTYRDRRILLVGAVAVAMITTCVLINLAPSLYAWHRYGKPNGLPDKVAAESEVYGLKIRQLVSPVAEHTFPPFRWWSDAEDEANFPLETENKTSRLGFVATLGFLWLLGIVFVPSFTGGLASAGTLVGASRLMMAAVLLGTIGGFGSLFSLLVSTQIRAYNRIAPFIAFFSFVAVAIALDAISRTRAWRIAAAVIVLAVGLSDQRLAAVQLNRQYPAISEETASLGQFVRELESRLPDGAMVLQLPFAKYLADPGVVRMRSYDHLKPSLVSHRLRWSYPAISNQQVRWQETAAALDPRELPSRMVAEGFVAVVIDRHGYQDGGIAAAVATVAGAAGTRILAQSRRYIALDIRPSAPPAPATAGLGPCRAPMLAAVDQIGMMGGTLTGDRLHVPGSREFGPTGWAVDQATGLPAKAVDVLVDGRVFRSVYGIMRDDVAAYFKQEAYRPAGFVAAIPMQEFSKGAHELALRVVASNGTCYFQTPAAGLIVD